MVVDKSNSFIRTEQYCKEEKVCKLTTASSVDQNACVLHCLEPVHVDEIPCQISEGNSQEHNITFLEQLFL